MKLEHLIQAFNFNRIPAHIKEKIEEANEKSGVIEFNENIYASYLLDEEGFVIALNLFINGVVERNKTIANQMKHVTEALIIIQKSMELFGNINKEEANKILEKLGLFSNKIPKEKAIDFLDYIYKINSVDGLLNFTILKKENKNLTNPPVKISKTIKS